MKYYTNRISLSSSLLIPVLILNSCSKGPRRIEEVSPHGERLITIMAPLSSTNEANTHLTFIRDIDGSEYPYEPPLWTIREITADNRGRLLICDNGHGHIIHTDSTGAYLGTIGRRGPGPFEFRSSGSSPLSVSIASDLDLIVVQDYFKLLLFQFDGSPVPSDFKSIQVFDILARSRDLILVEQNEQPFTLYSIDGSRQHRFGRLFDRHDTLWENVAEYIEKDEGVHYPDGQVKPGIRVFPNAYGIVGDSLLIHDLSYSNGLRCWNVDNQTVLWDLQLGMDGYEPPTLYTYRTSFTSGEWAWEKGGDPSVHFNTHSVRIRYRDGLLYVVNLMWGDGTRKKPSRRTVNDPFTVSQELNEGRRMRCTINVFSLEPDHLAYYSLEVDDYFTADILSGGILALGFDNPEPHLSLYRIQGIPQKKD